MKFRLFLSVILVIHTVLGFSQKCDTILLKKITLESHEQLSKDIHKSYKLALQAYTISKECPDTKYYFESVLCLSNAYYQKDLGDSVIKLILPILEKLPANAPIYYKAALNHKISSGYVMLMELEQGLRHSLEALKNYELIKDSANISNALVNVANIYQQKSNFKQSDKYLRQAQKIASKLKSKRALGNVYNTMGILYAEDERLDSAEKFFLLSTEIRELMQDYTALAWNYNNLGGIYVLLKKPKQAIVFLEKALAKFEQSENFDGQTSVANNLGELYINDGNYKKALEYFSYSRKLYSKTNNPDNLENLYANLSVYYDRTGDIKTAFRYSDSLIHLKDSLYGSKLDNSIAEMQTLYDVEKKDLQLLANQKEIEKEKAQRNFIISALLFFVLLFIISIWAFNQKRKTSRLLETKNNQLEHANQEILHQKEQLSEKQKEIVDSINYAKKIQTALLASEELLLENAMDHFVLFKPKDIVSGDFTWATKNNHLLYLACCDSTGHGVPGAFMSLLNIGFLSEAVKERHILEPGEIFNYVRDRLIETIGKDEQQDGFDGILLCINTITNTITYAAANNAPMVIRDNEVILLNFNKMPVGKGIKTDSFETYSLTAIKNDHLYLFTDGYPDQFGGPKGKKFKYKQLEELLKQNTTLDLHTQKEQLHERFESWKGPLEQVDDVCIVGIRIK
ncbi:MAG: tetratricopeptide repeat protein [Bacteroidota bacterium]